MPSETWMGKDSFYQPTITGYRFLNGELNERAGGVAFFIKKNIPFVENPKLLLNLENSEDLWIEIENSTGNKTTIGIIYRHPIKNDITNFQEKFNERITELHHKTRKFFILGDFNFNLVDDSYSDFTKSLLEVGCKQIVERPTRSNPIHDSLIDHIYTNCCDKDTSVDLIKEDLTDHHILHLISKDFIVMNKSQGKIRRRCTKNFSEESFCEDLKTKLHNLHGDLISHKSDIDYQFSTFIHCLQSVIDRHAPFVTLSKKQQKISLKPWISKGILKSYRTKKKLYHAKLRNKSPDAITKYKNYSNQLTRLKDAAKTLHYNKLFNSSSNNSKKNLENN